ncbi:DUF2284 domain-containing protein [Terrisporobacter sp.]|uniref:DUF2284 domain-containing protein n=1 Tax=Terrisporobacter sp. TaxID=1965305 RepID=UPI00260DBB3F|nr:DUF2284 domain-containing protein [Terrisporobacter sp.]
MIELNFIKDNNKINLKANVCKNDILKNYMKFEYFTALCKEGCPNYNSNYTCPPNSPTFTEYVKDYKYSLVIAMYMNIPKNKNMSEVHEYLRIVLSDLLIPLERKINGLLTDGGRCIYCKECAYIDNLPCRFPEKMRFSMESMGIDLDSACKDILNYSMSWNSDNENSYCTVIGSVNFNNIDKYDLKEIILDII